MSDESFDAYQKLSDEELSGLRESLPEWSVGSEGGLSILQRDCECSDFINAFACVAKITALAERHDHHPRVTLSYGAVRVEWWTHSSGGVSHKDVEMAKLTNSLCGDENCC